MTNRHTLFWLFLAAALLGFIVFIQPRLRNAPAPPALILPGLKASDVTAVIVRPAGQRDIRAERAKGAWQLTEPITYPAQAASIESLLALLERLTPAATFTAHDLEGRRNTDAEYGFDSPAASVIIQEENSQRHLLVGRKTAPGDQVFVQVVGVEAVYVVSTDLLRMVPAACNDWRDTRMIRLAHLTFDRITLTNGASFVELIREQTNGPWRMTAPIKSRADNARIEDALQKLGALGIAQFVSDDPKADLDSAGLQPPETTICIGWGTNTLAILQFGKSLTNDAQWVYARRLGLSSIVSVPRDMLASWRLSTVNDWRDPHLLSLIPPLSRIDVHSEESFSLVLETNGAWRALAASAAGETNSLLGFPADASLVAEMVSSLNRMQIVQFKQDVVTPPSLPEYGLASPFRQYILYPFSTNVAAAVATNPVVELSFGAVTNGKVFVKRADESSVYAVSTNDFLTLPSAAWQLRERRPWNFTIQDVARATMRQDGRVQEIVRKGDHSWIIATNSQGMINNEAAVEETVAGLAKMQVDVWVGVGDQARARFGFSDPGLQLTLLLKSGEKVGVQFGGQTSSGLPCAWTQLDGQPWVFQIPPLLWRDVQLYLSVPRNPGTAAK